jgi:hypothetical protein
MPTVRENWVDIVGRVRSIRADDSRPNFTTVTLDVDQTETVDDYPNFLADRTEPTAQILVPNAVLSDEPLSVGDRVRCRTRWAPPDQLFVHPHGLQHLPR